jgi:hypothetical protein
MFDAYLNTQTEFANLIQVEVTFNNCDRVALFNIEADSVDLELTDENSSTVVQTKTVDTTSSEWILEEIYIYPNATLKITLNKSGGTAKCGLCGIGVSTDVGATLYSPGIGFLDYSKKATNEFGQTYLNVGAWAKKPRIRTYIPFTAVDAVFNTLVAARGSLVMFEGNQGDSGYESLRVFGFIKDWDIQLDNPTVAWVTFDIQGVI